MKLMQHLQVEICLLTDLPSTEDYFSFLLNYCVLVLPLHVQVTKPDVRWSGVNLTILLQAQFPSVVIELLDSEMMASLVNYTCKSF